jgi:hypothetical protein
LISHGFLPLQYIRLNRSVWSSSTLDQHAHTAELAASQFIILGIKQPALLQQASQIGNLEMQEAEVSSSN